MPQSISRVRGIRGATTADRNTRDAIIDATTELLGTLVEENDLDLDDVAAAYFTTTQDLNAEFPAQAARKLGWEYVALLCGHEMNVPDSLPLCIRVLLLVNTDKTPHQLKPAYLRRAWDLRSRGTNEA